MCIFTGAVRNVSATRIFCRDRSGSPKSRVLAYEMKVALRQDVAMVLPVPVLEPEEDAVEFINLDRCKNFFDRVNDMFPEPMSLGTRAMGQSLTKSSAPLKVHDVGVFDASFVPQMGDFKRLDTRFQVPAKAWTALPDYSNFGFAVFQLKQGAVEEHKYHPMAIAYTPANPDWLFFPTTHLHHGDEVEEKAMYDHQIYWQMGGRFTSPINGTFKSKQAGSHIANSFRLRWESSSFMVPPGLSADSNGLMVDGFTVLRGTARGQMHNADILVSKDGTTMFSGLRAEPEIAASMECEGCGKPKVEGHGFCGHCGHQHEVAEGSVSG